MVVFGEGKHYGIGWAGASFYNYSFKAQKIGYNVLEYSFAGLNSIGFIVLFDPPHTPTLRSK